MLLTCGNARLALRCPSARRSHAITRQPAVQRAACNLHPRLLVRMLAAEDAATAEAEVPAAAEADSNGAQEQLLSPLDRARQALEGDNLDKSLMVSRNNQ
eukprot:GHRQ01009516.1.p2 GENE.GHRQ01009516.1~~GHRQ01009516.1.p2  ORF type:complete len:100 (+),score=21.82 GHRQ01009516.1:209-508(+)